MIRPTDIQGRKHLQWTPELVSRFWDNWASTRDLREQYFTFQIGGEISNFLSFATDLRGKHVFDFGCGPGFLAEHLLQRGAKVAAADYSAESVKAVNQRLAGRKGWEGAVRTDNGAIPLTNTQFDVITCIETIEHMFDEPLHDLLVEFQRLLKPGGLVMFTTPNEEDLDASSTYCPQCEHLFHQMQHMSSWGQQSLTAVLQSSGFRVDLCQGVDLRRWGRRPSKKLIDTSLRDFVGVAKTAVVDGYSRVADQLFPRPFPQSRAFRRRLPAFPPMHLVAIATKI